MGQKSEVRKKQIIEKLNRSGSILVKQLAEEFNASETTIRRDLNDLDSAGMVKQVYGGAVGIEKPFPNFNVSISSRSEVEIEAKKRIGKAAADLVQDNDIIYIDPGTTSWEMIPHLKTKRNLTIISNSVRLLLCLDYIGHHTIIQLGGTLRPDRLDTIGMLATLGIDQLRGYKAFQGGDGLDLEIGLSAIDHESSIIAKNILERARESYILADHTKLLNPGLFYRIIPLEKIKYLITDEKLSDAWAAKCGKLGITTIIAQ